MVQVIEEEIYPNRSERFAKAFQNVGEELPGIFGQLAENQALQKLTGMNLGGLSPDLKRAALSSLGKQEKSGPGQYLGASTNVINELENLIGLPGVGLMGQLNFSPEALQNKGKFQSLTAALLPIFKTMFPRGMTEKEFNIIKKDYIPQVGDTEAKIRGKLAGLRKLAEELSGGPQLIEEGIMAEIPEGKVKFNPQNPEHVSKLRQLDKKFKGDKAKVNKALAKEFIP